MKITVESNAVELSNWMRVAFADQMDFALSVGINTTAFDVRDAQRAGVEQRFTIRRPWVLGGIQVSKKATKTDLEAIVMLADDRDFLSRFEAGGVVRPLRASRFAVPQEAKRSKTDVVRKGDRPRAFNFKFWGRGAEGEVYRGNRRTWMFLESGQRSFGGAYSRGGSFIFQRVGRGRGSRLRMLWTFSPTVDLPANLEFEETGERTFADRFGRNWENAFDRATATAR